MQTVNAGAARGQLRSSETCELRKGEGYELEHGSGNFDRGLHGWTRIGARRAATEPPNCRLQIADGGTGKPPRAQRTPSIWARSSGWGAQRGILEHALGEGVIKCITVIHLIGRCLGGGYGNSRGRPGRLRRMLLAGRALDGGRCARPLRQETFSLARNHATRATSRHLFHM